MTKKILIRIGILLLLFVVVINIPIITVKYEGTSDDYSNWMKENLDNEIHLVDIKMLGAHDAFSSDINYFSKVDVSADSIMRGIPGTLLKGYLVRQSVTQITDTEGLLKSGVRYFDIRLTYNEDKWVTKHNYVSSDFDKITEDIVDYLETYQGEFLILDFQHINGLDYSNDEDYQIFIDMLTDSGLFDYNYTSGTKQLGEITYGDITSDKVESNVIIIDKFTKEEKSTYYYESSIRAEWANMDDFSDTLEFLLEESNLVATSTELDNSFKIMQAVTTTQMSLSGIKNSLLSWSLIVRASHFNTYLITHDDFETINDHLPIIMVDYSNSDIDDFVDQVMTIIIEKNSE